MKNSILTLITVILGIVFIMGDLQPVYSQESDTEEFSLEEIIVTAQKREQSAQDVPIAMAVVSDEQLERQKVYNLQDLGRTTAGLEFGDPSAGPGGSASIRGIGTSAFSGSMEPSVGIVLDSVDQGGRDVGSIFDVERVEVLRGPQGTLFGNSASGGVIQIITNKPDTERFESKVAIDATKDGTLGSKFGHQRVQAVVNVPISENSALRVIGNGDFSQKLKKADVPDQQDRDEKDHNFRAKYRFNPTDDFSIDIIGSFGQNKTEGQGLFTVGKILYDADGNMLNPELVEWIHENTNHISLTEDNQYTGVDHVEHGKSRNYGISGEVNWKMLNHNFVSITSYKKNKRYSGLGEMLGLTSPFMFEIVRDGRGGTGSSNTITQEFRLASLADSKLDYQAGLYYSRDRNPYAAPPYGVTTIYVPTPIGRMAIVTETTNISSSAYQNSAAFGHVTYPLTEAFKVSGGARYTLYEVDISQKSVVGEPDEHSYTHDKKIFTFDVGGQYDVNDSVMVYATIRRGTKSPVLQTPDWQTPNDPIEIIEPEIIDAYEIGTKIETLDNKLALDFNAYYTKVKNFQTQYCDRGEYGGLYCKVTNIDGYETNGFELDIFGQPIQNLRLNSSYSFIIAEYPGPFIDGETGNDLAGDQMLYTPRHKFTFSGEYGKTVTKNLYGYFTVDAVYKSKRRLNTYDFPESFYPAHWKFGSSIGIMDVDNKWNVSLFGRNLFDENEPTAYFPDQGAGLVLNIHNKQTFRQVGISVSMTF